MHATADREEPQKHSKGRLGVHAASDVGLPTLMMCMCLVCLAAYVSDFLSCVHYVSALRVLPLVSLR